jgi:hypothetical protein
VDDREGVEGHADEVLAATGLLDGFRSSRRHDRDRARSILRFDRERMSR